MKKVYPFVARSIFCLTLFISSCEKWHDNRNPQTALDHALAESSFLDIFRIVLAETKEHEGVPADVDSCSARTVTSANGNFITLRIDFGTDVCSFNYQIKRKGALLVSLNQALNQSNSRASVSLENFEVNNYLIEGTINIINKGIVNEKPQYELQVSDGKVTSKDGRIISWACDLTLERIEGQLSPDFVWDDKYSISGSASGTNYEGRNFSAEVKEPLLFEMVCRWIVQGTTELSIEELKNITVNYGSGNCDNDAEAKIGKRSYNLKLK